MSILEYPCFLLVFITLTFSVSCQAASLTFVIDDTYSMKDDIDEVKHNTKIIMNDALRSNKNINKVLLVTFNDPPEWSNVPPAQLRVNTSKYDEFKAALDMINVIGGGFCPEQSMAGILLALEESEPRSYIYVFTDASAKDYSRSAEVIELIQKKQSQVIFVLTGNCNVPSSPEYKVYKTIATASSGLIFEVPKGHVTNVIATIKETIKADTPLNTLTTPPGVWTDVKFCIDDQTEYAIIYAYGEDVQIRIPNDFKSETIMWQLNGKVIKLPSLPVGCHTVSVLSSSSTTVKITSKNDFNFRHGFSQLEPKSLEGTAPQPFSDTMTHLSVSVTDQKSAVRVISMQIMNMDEDVTKTLTLKRLSPNFYTTESFVAPVVMFKIALIGEEVKTGRPVRRLGAMPITPQKAPHGILTAKSPVAKIMEGSSITVTAGKELTLTCKVYAYPKPEIYWKNSRGTLVRSISSLLQEPYDYISYLKIPQAAEMDRYTCHAVNKAGYHSDFIDVIIDPFIVGTVPQGTTKINYGERLSLNCDVRAAQRTEPLKIHWYHTDRRTGVTKVIVPSKKFSVSSDGTQLTILSVYEDLVGKYTCVALLASSNSNRQFSTDVEINDEPARIISKASTFEGKVGDALLNISCDVVGYPKPTIKWQTNGSPITPNGKYAVENGGLIIKNLVLNDGTKYTCEVSNKAGTDRKQFNVAVYDPARIISKASTFEGKVGDSGLRIPCKVAGYPKPTINWEVNGSPITPSNKYAVEDEGLTIKNLVLTDGAKYSCKVKNKAGSDVKSFEVDVYDPARIIAKASSFEGKVGDSVLRIPCNVAGYPKPTINWEVNGSPITPSNKYTVEDEVLIIKNLVLTDGAKYSCKATNKAGSDVKSFEVAVYDPARIISKASNFEGKVGDSVLRVPCNVAGYPKPTINWEVNGSPITPSNKYAVEDEVLIIKNLVLTDGAKYSCKATNKAGSDVKSFEVAVYESPKIISVDSKYEGVVGDAVLRIPCKAAGSPKPAIKWEVHGSPITPNDKYDIEDGVLLIKNLLKSDGARYLCTVSNKAGSDAKTFEAHVYEPPRIIAEAYMYEGMEGDVALRIPCNTTGYPKPIIKWAVGGAPITPNSKYIVEDGALVIKTPVEADSNNYTCYAENKAGSDSAIFTGYIYDTLYELGAEHNIYIVEGESKKVECTLPRSEQSTISWFINTLSNNYTLKDVPYVDIVNAVQNNEGNYTCRVSDLNGTATETFVVDVGYPPTFNYPRENPLMYWTGDSGEKINCEYDADPEPMIEWTLDGKVLADEDKDQLEIRKVGYYSCSVKNPLGAIKMDFNVKLVSP